MSAVIMGLVGQKGGTGKSTLARAIAREYAAADWDVKIADLDPKQTTDKDWGSRRASHGHEPHISVEVFASLQHALRHRHKPDLLILDGPASSNPQTLKIAEASHLVILPTGESLDDLIPTIRLAHELVEQGIGLDSIVFVLCKSLDSERVTTAARKYIKDAGYSVLRGQIRAKTGYSDATKTGKTFTEASFPSLRKEADLIVQQIMNRIDKIITTNDRRAANG